MTQESHNIEELITVSLCQCISEYLCYYPTGCYGVDPAAVAKDWKCARCKANAMTEVTKQSTCRCRCCWLNSDSC